MKLLTLVLFGACGVATRYFIGLWFSKETMTFPYPTFFINIVGSFLIGFVYCLAREKMVISHDLGVAIMVGFLGGFTTFSALSLETFLMLETSLYLTAFIYVSLSCLAGLAATCGGIYLARTFIGYV